MSASEGNADIAKSSASKAPPLSFAACVGEPLFFSGVPGFDALPDTFPVRQRRQQHQGRVLDETARSTISSSSTCAVRNIVDQPGGVPPFQAEDDELRVSRS
jgi:hypothetical protein